uniref:Gem-associated protein 2 n=1 Tax=Hucho hucho TaxID=62062 RepID=A0A4W5QV70_9TELE
MTSDVEELMLRHLPVETCGIETGEDFNLNEPPRNPQEYLRQVQPLCPDVVVAKIDPKKLRKKQTVNVSLMGCQAAPQGFSPSLKWQCQQLLRNKMGNYRFDYPFELFSISKHRLHWSGQALDDNVLMPKQDAEEQWKKFCLGENVYLNSPPTDPVTEDPGLDYVKVTATVSAVLEYLINWFEEREFVPQLGRWQYALLACLEKPLLPEAHSLIRQLARRSSEVRTNLKMKGCLLST